MTQLYDHDVVVNRVGLWVGGGAPAAEKGYRVHVYEAGRRFADEDFADRAGTCVVTSGRRGSAATACSRSTGCRSTSSSAGPASAVALNYANTLYVPPEPFFRDPQWADITDWQAELAPHYQTAQRMLGVVENPCWGLSSRSRRTRRTISASATRSARRRSPSTSASRASGCRTPSSAVRARTASAAPSAGTAWSAARSAPRTLVKNYLALAERRGDDRATAHRHRSGRSIRRHRARLRGDDRARPGPSEARTAGR